MYTTYTVKGFKKNGKMAYSKDYNTTGQNLLNRDWSVVGRMVQWAVERDKCATTQVFKDGVEMIFNTTELEWEAK